METYENSNPAAQDMDDADLSEQELSNVAGGMGDPPGPYSKDDSVAGSDPGPTPFGGTQPWYPPTDPPQYGGSGDPRDPDPNRKASPTTF